MNAPDGSDWRVIFSMGNTIWIRTRSNTTPQDGPLDGFTVGWSTPAEGTAWPRQPDPENARLQVITATFQELSDLTENSRATIKFEVKNDAASPWRTLFDWRMRIASISARPHDRGVLWSITLAGWLSAWSSIPAYRAAVPQQTVMDRIVTLANGHGINLRGIETLVNGIGLTTETWGVAAKAYPQEPNALLELVGELVGSPTPATAFNSDWPGAHDYWRYVILPDHAGPSTRPDRDWRLCRVEKRITTPGTPYYLPAHLCELRNMEWTRDRRCPTTIRAVDPSGTSIHTPLLGDSYLAPGGEQRLDLQIYKLTNNDQWAGYQKCAGTVALMDTILQIGRWSVGNVVFRASDAPSHIDARLFDPATAMQTLIIIGGIPGRWTPHRDTASAVGWCAGVQVTFSRGEWSLELALNSQVKGFNTEIAATLAANQPATPWDEAGASWDTATTAWDSANTAPLR